MLMTYKKISIISFLLINLFLTGCALFEENTTEIHKITEREQMFANAEAFYKNNNFESARLLYFRLSRNIESVFDPIYDQSLWRLVKIYEKNDESEKALLTLDELSTRKSSKIEKNKIKFAQIKNNFRVTNFYQAKELKKEIDESYKNKTLSLEEIYDYLVDTTEFTNDHHLLEELMFLGEVQKYFIFIMESSMSPENEQLTERLINNYEHFFTALKQSMLSTEFKKKLSISLLDQLRKFDQYKIDTSNLNTKTITRFLNYSEIQQKILVESFRL